MSKGLKIRPQEWMRVGNKEVHGSGPLFRVTTELMLLFFFAVEEERYNGFNVKYNQSKLLADFE
jgi:hypothetical protein